MAAPTSTGRKDFRVHVDSTPEKWIVDSIVRNTTGRPVVAQLIGNDVPSLVRTAAALQQLPVAAIDLNLGCPAPIVYRKCAGGGLLRERERIDAILGALRDAVAIPFTVKTRLGFAIDGGVRRAAADLRAALARRAHRARAAPWRRCTGRPCTTT